MEAPPSGEDEGLSPAYKNYLVFCDESGMNGNAPYYGFGSFWIPNERRGDLKERVRELRARYGYRDEMKWTGVNRHGLPFYTALVQEFFTRPWMMFHALLVRRGYVDLSLHKNREEAMRKHYSKLLANKIRRFSRGWPEKAYHVRVDKLPFSYAKAGEAAFKIIAATLRKEINLDPLKSLHARDSKLTDGIQIADVLLGAALAPWQDSATSQPKLRLQEIVAEHLGWKNLKADTTHDEWKFNLWYFYDPTTRAPREVKTRSVRLKIAMPPLRSSR